MKSKTQIERIAANCVRTYIDETNKLRSYIDDNDKTPMWDGSIFVYREEPDKNKNLEGAIKTQIKGRTVSKFHNKVKFNIPTYNIENYMKGAGLVYFVVELIKQRHWVYKIFYILLPPIELKSLLKRNKGKNEVSIILSPLPTEFYLLEEELRDFLINSVKQQSYINTPTLRLKDAISHDERVVLETEFVTTKDSGNIWAAITERPIYLYKKTEYSSIPIEDAAIFTQVKELMPYSVSIKGKKYFDNYIRIMNYNQIEYHIDDFLILRTPRERFKEEHMASSTFDIKYNTLLSICKKKLEFTIEMLVTKSITLGDETIPLFSSKEEEKKTLIQFTEELNLMCEIEATWKEFNIPYELDFKELNEDGREQLGNLVYYVHRHMLGTPKSFQPGDDIKYSLISFGKTKVMVLFKKEIDNKFYSYNAFDPCQRLLGTVEGDNIVVPLLSAMLNQNKEYIVDNVNYEIMKEMYNKCLRLDRRFTTYIKNDIITLTSILSRETRNEKKNKVLDLIKYLKQLL